MCLPGSPGLCAAGGLPAQQRGGSCCCSQGAVRCCLGLYCRQAAYQCGRLHLIAFMPATCCMQQLACAVKVAAHEVCPGAGRVTKTLDEPIAAHTTVPGQ